MSAKRFWAELKSGEFASLDPGITMAILPVAATEQHGPHLPVMTDTAIAEGMIRTVLARLPDELSVLYLPIQMIGKSNEHLRSPGTITYSAENLIRIWVEIGESIARAGLRKMVIVNSHGGNTEVIGIVARELRVRQNMLVATTQWRRFGLPASLYSDFDARHGIHAGDIETSLMLHFRPDLVDMAKARLFPSKAADMEHDYMHLRPAGQHGFGWIAQDLNADGALGDASAATAEKGRLTAAHQADGFIALLRDVARFPLDQLAKS
ncbi:MAG TPA: creatininase family protein [Pseudomonadota bacterium]|nr:creatininase family protein [Pseudomonadota bacterium]